MEVSKIVPTETTDLHHFRTYKSPLGVIHPEHTPVIKQEHQDDFADVYLLSQPAYAEFRTTGKRVIPPQLVNPQKYRREQLGLSPYPKPKTKQNRYKNAQIVQAEKHHLLKLNFIFNRNKQRLDEQKEKQLKEREEARKKGQTMEELGQIAEMADVALHYFPFFMQKRQKLRQLRTGFNKFKMLIKKPRFYQKKNTKSISSQKSQKSTKNAFLPKRYRNYRGEIVNNSQTSKRFRMRMINFQRKRYAFDKFRILIGKDSSTKEIFGSVLSSMLKPYSTQPMTYLEKRESRHSPFPLDSRNQQAVNKLAFIVSKNLRDPTLDIPGKVSKTVQTIERGSPMVPLLVPDISTSFSPGFKSKLHQRPEDAYKDPSLDVYVSVPDQRKHWAVRPHHIKSTTNHPLSIHDGPVPFLYPNLPSSSLQQPPSSRDVAISQLEQAIADLRCEIGQPTTSLYQKAYTNYQEAQHNPYLYWNIDVTQPKKQQKIISHGFREDKLRNVSESYEAILEELRRRERELLNVKRHELIEENRAPTDKWYELKTKEFSTELHRNMLALKPNDGQRKLMNMLGFTELY